MSDGRPHRVRPYGFAGNLERQVFRTYPLLGAPALAGKKCTLKYALPDTRKGAFPVDVRMQPALPLHHLKLPSHLCSLFGCFRRNWYTSLRKTNRCAQRSQNGRVSILMRCLNCAYPVMLHRACFCRFLYAVVPIATSARDCEVATDRADRGLFNNKRTARCDGIEQELLG